MIEEKYFIYKNFENLFSSKFKKYFFDENNRKI